MKRIPVGPRQAPNNRVDATQWVFMCTMCPWQIQASNAARRDFGLDGLLEQIAWAQLDHNRDAHADGGDVEVEFEDGSTHAAAGPKEGALAVTALPRWWVNK